MSGDSHLLFSEKRPSIREKANDVAKDFPYYSFGYVKSLFPIFSWIGRYNLTWLTCDVIAGLTVGAVVIPQSLGYAKIAGLPPEFGLYSSFVGVLFYCIFATSKDITIGPTAAMSLLLGQSTPKIIDALGGSKSPYSAPEVAVILSFFSGIIALGFGFFRLGIIAEFIPGPVIAGFITGSAISISVGQIPNLFGVSDYVNTKTDPTYKILGNSIKNLNGTTVDVVIGLLSLLFLYTVKYGCAYGEKRFTRWKRFFFFAGILRYVVCITITTFIAWLVLRHKSTKHYNIKVTGSIPSGLKHIGVPPFKADLIAQISSYLPIAVLILSIEHMAIAKSFGRLNNYKIFESQEFVAIGITNVIGAFFGAYPATGSFSRTALKSKAGVRTPIADVFSGILVLLAIYFLTPVFYFIPNAGLAAVIIHAVLGLVATPSYIKQIYRIQFLDFLVFTVGVVVTFFVTIEWGIYSSTGLALVVLLIRIARPRLDALGRLALVTFGESSSKYAYVPLDHPSFTSVQQPPDGILIFRFDESLTYPNSNYIDNKIVEYVKQHTRCMHKITTAKGDRAWNDAGNNERSEEENQKLPQLRGIIFDFSAVSCIDSTGIQALMGTKKEVNKFAGRYIEYHFAHILDEHIQDALLTGGFGKLELSPDQLTLHDKEASEVNEKIAKRDEETGKVHQEMSQKRFFHLTIDEAIATIQ